MIRMSAVVKEIRQAGPRTLEIEWADQTVSRFDVRQLRLACPCANCIDELTGKKTLDPATIPEDVKPVNIKSVGSYAISISWSDGHDTGIYSFERLKQMG